MVHVDLKVFFRHMRIKIGEFYEPITVRPISELGFNYKFQSLNEKLRGYIFSRKFFGERVPQHIQNQIIQSYCKIHKMEYLLSATEYNAWKQPYFIKNNKRN